MKAEAGGCAEEPLGPLAAALRELRAAMADPSQYDGEGLAAGRAICSGCPWAEWASSRARAQVSPAAAPAGPSSGRPRALAEMSTPRFDIPAGRVVERGEPALLGCG